MNKTEEFINKSKEVHGDVYDYTITNYTRSSDKVRILCKKHGEFEQIARNHSNGAGCLKCWREKQVGLKTTDLDKLLIEFNNKHNNKYDYSLVEYKNCKENIKVICPTHGVFQVTADNHKRKDGCSKCRTEERTNRNKKIFIEKAKEIHGDKYDYSKVDYKNSKTKIEIVCSTHGSFEQTPNSHNAGNGCPTCSRLLNTYSRTDYIKLAKKAILYIVCFENEKEKFYKIGKTINSIKRRFFNKTSNYKYTSIFEYEGEIDFIFDLEIELHKKHRQHSYKPYLNFSGCTECYNLQLPIDEIINNLNS